MVEGRCGDHAFEPAHAPTQIGVQHIAPGAGHERHDQRHPVELIARGLSQAKQVQRQVAAQAHDDEVQRMSTRVDEPIQLARAVMHGMKAPQPVRRMHGAVAPVEAQLGHEHGQGKARPAGQIGQARQQAVRREVVHQPQQQRDRHDDDLARQHAGEKVVQRVDAPAAAQHALAVQGEEPLERHEEHHQQHQAVAELQQLEAPWRQGALYGVQQIGHDAMMRVTSGRGAVAHEINRPCSAGDTLPARAAVGRTRGQAGEQHQRHARRLGHMLKAHAI